MDIRPFTISVPEEQLVDLRRRITATRWPDREVDPTQGVQLDVIQALARYWATDYDWRAFEARFAAWEQPQTLSAELRATFRSLR